MLLFFPGIFAEALKRGKCLRIATLSGCFERGEILEISPRKLVSTEKQNRRVFTLHSMKRLKKFLTRNSRLKKRTFFMFL